MGVCRSIVSVLVAVLAVVLVPMVVLVCASVCMRALGVEVALPERSFTLLNAVGVSPTTVASMWPPVSFNPTPARASVTSPPTSGQTGGAQGVTPASSSSKTISTSAALSQSDVASNGDYTGDRVAPHQSMRVAAEIDHLTMAQHLAQVASLDHQGKLVEAAG